MPQLRKRSCVKRFFFLTLSLAGLVVVAVFLAVPLAYRFFPSLMRNSIFVANEEVPRKNDYEHPEKYGFSGAQNFYLTTDDGTKIGVWHTLPITNQDSGVSTTTEAEDGVTRLYEEPVATTTVAEESVATTTDDVIRLYEEPVATTTVAEEPVATTTDDVIRLYEEPVATTTVAEKPVATTTVAEKPVATTTVFLYLHGSAGTRTSTHRLRTYQLLNQLGYHVVTFDYRGYGDSTSKTIGESDLTKDTVEVFHWIKKNINATNIFLWGHSLGTGVASLASDYIFSQMKDKETIKGVVLEAPFNNMASTVRASPLTQFFSFLPWFDYCFTEPLHLNGLGFESDVHLRNIKTPVLILHAMDDTIIPINLATKLYSDVAASREDRFTVKMETYDSSLNYGHYNITKDPNIRNLTRSFVEKFSH